MWDLIPVEILLQYDSVRWREQLWDVIYFINDFAANYTRGLIIFRVRTHMKTACVLFIEMFTEIRPNMLESFALKTSIDSDKSKGGQAWKSIMK